MEETVLALGLKNEFEGDQALWFDLNDPETPKRLCSYLRDNIDLDEERIFSLKKFSKQEFAELVE